MRHILKLWLLLVSFALPAWGMVPTVSRQFSSSQIGPESTILVSLSVHFPEDGGELPGAWLLAENWPRGWTLDEACWNGEPLEPMKQAANDTTHYWLFGCASTPSVSNGTLTYLLHAPENFSASRTMNSADGVVYTYNDMGFVQGSIMPSEEESAQPPRYEWQIQPGWSLQALPCEPDEISREFLRDLDGAFFQISKSQESYHRDGIPPMGMPFWLYSPATETLTCELTAAYLTDTPEPLRAAAPVRHRQWNLFGVCGDNPVRLATGVNAWRWQTDHYEPCEENAILQPGEAVWLYVE